MFKGNIRQWKYLWEPPLPLTTWNLNFHFATHCLESVSQKGNANDCKCFSKKNLMPKIPKCNSKLWEIVATRGGTEVLSIIPRFSATWSTKLGNNIVGWWIGVDVHYRCSFVLVICWKLESFIYIPYICIHILYVYSILSLWYSILQFVWIMYISASDSFQCCYSIGSFSCFHLCFHFNKAGQLEVRSAKLKGFNKEVFFLWIVVLL